jgi:hypothetical protein
MKLMRLEGESANSQTALFLDRAHHGNAESIQRQAR